MLKIGERLFWSAVGTIAVLSLVSLFFSYLEAFEQCESYFAGKESPNHHLALPYVTGKCILRAIGGRADSIAYVLTALATGGLVIYTLRLAKIASDQSAQLARTNDQARRIERAYIQVIHDAPGIRVDPDGSGGLVTIRVRNSGHTPAKVTDVLVDHIIWPSNERLPRVPRYQGKKDAEPPKVSLTSGEDFFFFDRITGLLNEGSVHYIVGYVDYIDAFGERHRTGYGSIHKPARDDPTLYGEGAKYEERTNLVFITQDGYNYDRCRQRDEGNDWDQK